MHKKYCTISTNTKQNFFLYTHSNTQANYAFIVYKLLCKPVVKFVGVCNILTLCYSFNAIETVKICYRKKLFLFQTDKPQLIHATVTKYDTGVVNCYSTGGNYLLNVNGTSHKMIIKHGKGEQFQGKYKISTRKGQNTF